MTHYDIFRGQLAIKYPSYGHALWEPSPSEQHGPVEVGDVGFIREGRFYRLFNALLSADHPSHKSGVPEHHEPLILKLADHVVYGTLSPGHYCSAGIDMIALEPDVRALGLGDCPKASFLCKTRRGGAVLSLPVPAHRQDTIAREAFGKWMVTHIDRWFAFARQLELGIEQMEELILATGCDLARSWTNVVVLKNRLDAQVCFGGEVSHGPEGRISWQVSPEQIRDAVFNQGPSGKNLPEDQCIFIRGFRVARTLGILPKHLRAAAKPSTDTDGDDWDSEPEVRLISIPTVSKYRDPLYFIFDYVAGRSPDCDMVLVHDVDLTQISGICDSNSLETLQQDVVENHLQDSNVEIQTDSYRLSSVKNNDPQIVRVAVLSMITHKPNVSPQSPPASFVSENVDLHYLTQYLAINPQGLKGREDDSNLRGSLTRTDMSGQRGRSTQNTTSHQVISVDAHPAPRPIYLLDFPPELMTRILLCLSPLDIISCRRTCCILYELCNNSIFRYLVQLERSALSDGMSPGLSYPERLRILEKREEAWTMLNFHQSINIPIPFNQCTHWSFADGALSFGTALDYEDRGSAKGHSYITLPSLSDAQDQKFEWKSHRFETEVMDVELAMREHDMMVALTTKEDVYHPYERSEILELRLLSFSTGQPHPLAEQPVIFVDKKIQPLYWRTCEMEIVGDFLILLVSFYEQSRSQDIFFLVRWKTGLTHRLASPEKGTYQDFTHISPDTLVIPNLIRNTLEITKIVFGDDDAPYFVLLCVLCLPPLVQNASLSRVCCRAKPKPTGSGRLVIPSRSDRPFHDKAEDAIVIFNMSYDLLGTQTDLLTLIVHRRSLLAHIPATHKACAPSCSTPNPTPALVEVPWSVWGPPATRLFMGNGMHHIATTAGQRAVMLEDRMPTPIIVRDFNPYTVRTARALASENGRSQQENWTKQLPNKNRMSLKVEDSGVSASSIFTEDVWSSLPYVEIVTQCEYQYDGVMMDDERILGFQWAGRAAPLQTNHNGLLTSFLDVHVLG